MAETPSNRRSVPLTYREEYKITNIDFGLVWEVTRIVLIVVLSFGVLWLGFVAVRGAYRKVSAFINGISLPTIHSTSNNGTPESASATTNTFHIINEQFTIEPNQIRPVAFYIPSSVSSGRVYGGFRVLNGEPVAVWIVDEKEYQKWNDPSSPFEPQYQSSPRANTRINRRLPSGNYYLVFESQSSDSNTTIAAEFLVEY